MWVPGALVITEAGPWVIAEADADDGLQMVSLSNGDNALAVAKKITSPIALTRHWRLVQRVNGDARVLLTAKP